MKNKKISKDTIVNLLATREYQSFVKEWLDLYDRYFKMNPKPFKQIKMDVEHTLIIGFFDKIIQDRNDFDSLNQLLDIALGFVDTIKQTIVVNGYER